MSHGGIELLIWFLVAGLRGRVSGRRKFLDSRQVRFACDYHIDADQLPHLPVHQSAWFCLLNKSLKALDLISQRVRNSEPP